MKTDITQSQPTNNQVAAQSNIDSSRHLKDNSTSDTRKANRAIFTVQDLSFAYSSRKEEKSRTVFDNLNLTFTEGVITTLIGANGSGKSTLFNLMTKNLKPNNGRIMLRGGDVSHLRLSDLSKFVAIVHQKNTAPYDVPVRKLVEYGRYVHTSSLFGTLSAEDESKVAWALETCGIADLADIPAGALSGGQLQRVWIAMALAQGTNVLLLDEPTTYLDVRYQLEVLQLIKRLNREFGITIIMVLHDINQAIQYSDEIVAMQHGVVIAQGSPDLVITPELLESVYGVELQIAQVNERPFVLCV